MGGNDNQHFAAVMDLLLQVVQRQVLWGQGDYVGKGGGRGGEDRAQGGEVTINILRDVGLCCCEGCHGLRWRGWRQWWQGQIAAASKLMRQ